MLSFSSIISCRLFLTSDTVSQSIDSSIARTTDNFLSLHHKLDMSGETRIAYRTRFHIGFQSSRASCRALSRPSVSLVVTRMARIGIPFESIRNSLHLNYDSEAQHLCSPIPVWTLLPSPLTNEGKDPIGWTWCWRGQMKYKWCSKTFNLG